MNKKFFIAWLVVFIAWMAGDFLVHGALLKSDYMQLAKLYRSEAESQQYFPWMLLAHVLMAGAFTWIYSFGSGSEAVGGSGRPLRSGGCATGCRPRILDLLRSTAAFR